MPKIKKDKRGNVVFPAGPCGELWCICSGGPHVGCTVAKERDQLKREFLTSLSDRAKRS